MSLAPLPDDAPTLADVRAAAALLAAPPLAGQVRRTPLRRAEALSVHTGRAVHLKLETEQASGAFKLRGALHRLARLDAQERARGVVTASTGNHGRAVAQAARSLGVRAVVCLSALVPAHKRDAIAALGAELRVVGQSQDDAMAEAQRLADGEGLVPVPPFDHPHVIAGQGTIALELLAELPALDTVLVPLSGGGLIAGIALTLKALRPGVRVVGLSMERGAAMIESLRAGRPVVVTEQPSLADSLGGGIGLANRYTFPLVQRHVDAVATLSEAEIAAGMRHLFRAEGITAEGAGAVGPAALLAGKAGALGAQVVCVVSGGNVAPDAFRRAIAE